MINKIQDLLGFLHNKRLVGIIILLLITAAVPLTVIIAQQQQEIRQRAAEPDNQIGENLQPEFASGEVLVKFKTTAPVMRVHPEALSQGIDLDKKAVSLSDIEQNTLPSGLNTLNQKYKIKTIEKVFKKIETGQVSRPEIPKAGQIDLSRIYKLEFDSSAPILEIIQELKKDPQIEYAELNYIMTTQVVPNDPYYPQMWGLSKIQIENAWEITRGSNDVIAAVIDTGIDYKHEDLGGCFGPSCRVVGGYDFVNNDNDPIDDEDHGTHVAGTIGALVNNSKGISGINWDVKLMAVKVLNSSGKGTMDNVAKGIKYAADNAVKVINMSLGVNISCVNTQTIQDAISYANGKNVTVVVGVGNSSKDAGEFSPASCNEVIAVAATGPTDERSSYSNYGYVVDLAAPGGDNGKCSDKISCLIHSTVLNNQYDFYQGTSMASPHVAGVAALLLAKNPALAPVQIENILENSAFDLEDKGFDIKYGFGRIDANKALLEMNTKPTLKPLIDLPTNLRINSLLEIKGTAEGDGFNSYILEYTTEDNPANWQSQGITLANNGTVPVVKGTLGTWSLPQLKGEKVYLLRLTINTISNEKVSVIKRLIYDPKVKSGWPFLFKKNLGSIYNPIVPTISDVDKDNKKEIIFFKQHRAFLLRENGATYPGWENYFIGEGPWQGMAYPPVTADVDSGNLGKEIIFGSDSIRAVGLQNNRNFSFFDYPLNPAFVNIYESLVVLQELKGTPPNFIVAASEQDGIKIHKINSKGRREWSIMPIGLSPDWAPKVVLGNVTNIQDQNLVVSYGKPTRLYNDKIVILNPNGNTITSWSIPGHRSASVLLGDVDGDGIKEIITDGLSSKNTIEINIFKGNGTKIATFDTNSPDRAGFVLADFNNDNKIDVFVDNNHGYLSVIDGTGSVIAQGSDPYPLERPYPMRDFRNTSRYGVDIEYYDAAVGDLDADGKKDIIKQGKTQHNKFSYYFYTVDETQIKTDTFPSLPLNKEVFSPVSIDDLDNDGKTEIVFIDDYDTDFALYVMSLNTDLASLDWPQYLHDEHHTGAGSIVTLSVNHPPVLHSLNDKIATVGEMVKFGVSASDHDEDVLSFSAKNLPQGALFIPLGDATLNGVLDKGDAVFITTKYLLGQLDSLTPFEKAASDIDENGVINKIDIDRIIALTSGREPALNKYIFLWQPTNQQVGIHELTFTVSDGSLEDSKTIRITVQPSLSPTPTPSGFCTSCSADINKDGKVNTSDLTLVRRCLNKSANYATGSYTCSNRDINKDGIIDIVDMNCVARNIGKACVR